MSSSSDSVDSGPNFISRRKILQLGNRKEEKVTYSRPWKDPNRLRLSTPAPYEMKGLDNLTTAIVKEEGFPKDIALMMV
jgi:hypothetical protein